MSGSWYELLENPKAVTGLFDEPPNLEAVSIPRILFEQTDVHIWVDLHCYPEAPPERWEGNDSLLMQLSLWFLKRRIVISGRQVIDARERLTFESQDEDIEIRFGSRPELRFNFTCQHVYLQEFVPFQRLEDGPHLPLTEK